MASPCSRSRSCSRAISVLAVAGYLVSNWGFTLTHAARDGSWHLRRGLFTTRETSLDDERVSGVSIGEPIGLRLARRRTALGDRDRPRPPAVGQLDAGAPGPPGGRDRGRRQVLGTDEPVTTTLRSHGPRARTRRFSRALVPTLVLSLALVLAVVAGAPTWLLVVAVGPSRGGRGPGGRPGEVARARPDRASLRGQVRQPLPAAPGPGDDGDHRMELPLDLVPAPGRPDDPQRHHRRREPVGDRARRTRAGRGGGVVHVPCRGWSISSSRRADQPRADQSRADRCGPRTPAAARRPRSVGPALP